MFCASGSSPGVSGQSSCKGHLVWPMEVRWSTTQCRIRVQDRIGVRLHVSVIQGISFSCTEMLKEHFHTTDITSNCIQTPGSDDYFVQNSVLFLNAVRTWSHQLRTWQWQSCFPCRPAPPATHKPRKNFRVGRPLPKWGEALPQDVSLLGFDMRVATLLKLKALLKWQAIQPWSQMWICRPPFLEARSIFSLVLQFLLNRPGSCSIKRSLAIDFFLVGLQNFTLFLQFLWSKNKRNCFQMNMSELPEFIQVNGSHA